MKKSEKTKITVSKIIEAAMEEFGRNGYAGGTVNHICQTGIHKGLLYHHFSGKDALYLACLRRSAEKLICYIQERNGTEDLQGYLAARMHFFRECSRESHIFFDALLNPPTHLSAEIQGILSDFQELNTAIYEKNLDTLRLRDGVSKADAIAYFHLFQLALNGYFGSSACHDATLQERTTLHEQLLPKLLDCMLYGIAKEGK